MLKKGGAFFLMYYQRKVASNKKSDDLFRKPSLAVNERQLIMMIPIRTEPIFLLIKYVKWCLDLKTQTDNGGWNDAEEL